MLRLFALVLPLGLDTFAVAAAGGVAGMDRSRRLRLSLVFAGFEGVMPLVGFLVGAGLGAAIGSDAEVVAGALLVGIGSYLLWAADESDDPAAASGLAHMHGWMMIGLGISVSVDELAIGFSAGLLRISILPAVVLIVVQAFVMAQLGIRLGQRVGERVLHGAEALAAVVLILLGVVVLAARAYSA
jgi:manganese efflux pump family protein